MKRLRDWVQARIDAAILPVVKRCVADAVQPVDYDELAGGVNAERLAAALACSSGFAKSVAAEVDASDVACHVDASDVAFHVDASDVAFHVDASDVARYVDLDTSDLAENVEVDASDVAKHLDYRRLCLTLLAELKGVKA